MSVYRPGTNKSSTLNYPTIRPTLNLDFANTKTLDPRITFTRSSAGSYVGADGLIKYAGVNEARFDHDPITGESLGLLIEESRTNYETNGSDNLFLMQYSNWVSDNSITYPDGRTIGGYNIFDQLSGPRFFLDFNPGPGNATYTCSVYARLKTGSTATQCYVNVKDTVSDTVRGSSGYVTLTNQWQRITATGTTAGATAGLRFEVGVNVNGASAQAYFWGAQVEQGSFASSYIPTVASTITRAADSASITGRNFSSFYRQDEGTFISSARYDGTPIPGVLNRVLFNVTDSNNGVIYYNHWWEQTNKASLIVEYPPGSYLALLSNGPTLSIGDRRKTASVYKKNDFALTANGASLSLDTSGEIKSTHANLYIGNLFGVTWFFCGRIARLTYYPQRLPNAQLQALTR
jgi:hypothetical protein